MQKRENFTELYFRITLSSVFIASFAFVKQIHRAMPMPLLKFSDKDYTLSLLGLLILVQFCCSALSLLLTSTTNCTEAP